MRRMTIAFTFAIMASMALQAQEQADGRQQVRPRMTQEQLIKLRTNGMVKRYGLSDEQAAKLQELNEAYSVKLFSGRRGTGFRGRQNADQNREEEQQPDGQSRTERQERMKQRMQEMQSTYAEYEKELQKIFSAEQYKKYQADRQTRMNRRWRNSGDGK